MSYLKQQQKEQQRYVMSVAQTKANSTHVQSQKKI